jgi:hypothetical protein
MSKKTFMAAIASFSLLLFLVPIRLQTLEVNANFIPYASATIISPTSSTTHFQNLILIVEVTFSYEGSELVTYSIDEEPIIIFSAKQNQVL